MKQKDLQILFVVGAVVALIIYYKKHKKEVDQAAGSTGSKPGTSGNSSAAPQPFTLGNGSSGGLGGTDTNQPVDVSTGVGLGNQVMTVAPGSSMPAISTGLVSNGGVSYPRMRVINGTATASNNNTPTVNGGGFKTSN